MDSIHRGPQIKSTKDLWKLTVGAVGVVFGDIGTSPLYAIKECFYGPHGIHLSTTNVYGVLSLIFWSIIFIVCLKYLTFILRADYQGEGGIMALLALLANKMDKNKWTASMAVMLGLAGSALLYGDGMITPAISVLSAIEGIQVATPALQSYVIPITCTILIALFAMQSVGTSKVASVFGPTVVVWFITLACIGAPWVFQRPEIFQAILPHYAVRFFLENGWHGTTVLGAVFLCITGAEALYADMGHFGKKPIQYAWFFLIFPCLLLNYFGQGALLLEKGEAVVSNPFYFLVGDFFLYPLVFIATCATVVASQALISGAFSLTAQAVQLGYLPRIKIIHTSKKAEGQIYIPAVNWFLMISCIALVIGFGESSDLASAYGIAVVGTMVITTILFYLLMKEVWKWKLWIVFSLTSLFLFVESFFVIANIPKIIHGGWVPLVVAGMILIVMTTWKAGRGYLAKETLSRSRPLKSFLHEVMETPPHRVQGTAVFLTANLNIAPHILVHHLKHNQILHEQVVLLSILTEHIPEVPGTERVRVTELQAGFFQVIARYGYMQTPNVPEILLWCESCGLKPDRDRVSFYLGRDSLISTGNSGLSRLRKKIFTTLSRQSRPASDFYGIPVERTMEIGSRISI